MEVQVKKPLDINFQLNFQLPRFSDSPSHKIFKRFTI